MKTAVEMKIDQIKPTPLRRLAFVVLFIAMIGLLTGCDTIYRSAKVIQNQNDGPEVRVVPLTDDTVLLANQSHYVPKPLPAFFSQTAATPAGSLGIGALPVGPIDPPKRQGPKAVKMPPPAVPGAYAIGVADVVLLSTPWNGSTLQEISGLLAAQSARPGYTVQDDGSINVPNAGRVIVAGKTIKEAEAILFRKLVESQIEPTFSLEIAEFNSQKISVGGAVEKPNIVPVTLAPIYLDEALAAAGGVVGAKQDDASVRLYRDGHLYQIPLSHLYSKSGRVKVRLINGDAVFVDIGADIEGGQKYFEQQLLLLETRQRFRQAALEALQVEVSLLRDRQNDQRENFLKAQSIGANRPDYVYLSGEVGVQSRFALPFAEQAVLADALFEGGGIAPGTGDVSQIYVLRGPTKTQEFRGVTAWHLNALNAVNFVVAAEFQLRPKDIIFVAEQSITRWDRAVSQAIPNFDGATSIVGN